MSEEKEEKQDIYIIPPNFIDTGTIYGGSIKLRNGIEAAIIFCIIAYFVFQFSFTLTTKILILIFTVFPAAIFAIIGINNESITSFIINFFRFLKKRRILGLGSKKKKLETNSKNKFLKKVTTIKHDAVEIEKKTGIIAKNKNKYIKIINETSDFIPIDKIENGIVYTKDKRYVKIIEVYPVNFMLRSAREQRNIIFSFMSFLKVAPVKVQFKIFSRKADINKHIEKVKIEMENENDTSCRLLQEDYITLLRKIGSREAVTRKFYIIFEYEPGYGEKASESDAISQLATITRNVSTYLKQCGNEVYEPDNEDEFLIDVFYNIINRKKSSQISIKDRVAEVIKEYLSFASKNLNNIPEKEFIAPKSFDFSHYNYVKVDGVYYSYLLIPSDGYKSQVWAGWLSTLINAGEGIDVDLFYTREPKDRTKMKLGQQIRINRSKIKDTNDTNDDFEDLANSIQSGYFLKRGLSGNQEFYYINILITITGDSPEELNWRVREMRKLMVSQDLDIQNCYFREEEAFMSSLPLCNLDKRLFKFSKRNLLTRGLASCYPFTSFEMSDENGIMFGVNKYNNSLVIVDIFNTYKYKNANMALLGTTGAGKTFTLQLIASRFRRKGIPIIIVAPEKGHEFLRMCNNVSGEFIQLSPASKNCINFMEIRQEDTISNDLLDGIVLEKSKLVRKIEWLHLLFSIMLPDINFEEKQFLEEAALNTYELFGITHENESLIDPFNPDNYKKMPLPGDLYNQLEKLKGTYRLTTALKRYVSGNAKSFNQQTNVHLKNKFTVIDLSELKGESLLIAMLIAFEFVYDRSKEDRTEEIATFFDELWKLIDAGSNSAVALYILEFFKLIRGYGGSAICATQDLSDLYALENGKYGKGILNACKTKIILNLEEDEANLVKSTLNLSDMEIMSITHFQRGHGLVSTNNNNLVVEFKASDYEKELITTDRLELQEILKAKALKESEKIS